MVNAESKLKEWDNMIVKIKQKIDNPKVKAGDRATLTKQLKHIKHKRKLLKQVLELQEGDFVTVAFRRNRLGVVANVDLRQNFYYDIWVKWEGSTVIETHSPENLVKVPECDREWYWQDGKLTRKLDNSLCCDYQVLREKFNESKDRKSRAWAKRRYNQLVQQNYIQESLVLLNNESMLVTGIVKDEQGFYQIMLMDDPDYYYPESLGMMPIAKQVKTYMKLGLSSKT